MSHVEEEKKEIVMKTCPFKLSHDLRPFCDREKCMIFKHGECALSKLDDLIALLVRRV